jgi:UDPglucose 6-dehydrogenase
MKIGLIGCDIVGLTFALLCEQNGHEILISEDEDFVYNLNQKVVITNEPLIQSLLLDSNRLSGTTNPIDVIKHSDIIFTFSEPISSIEGIYDTSKVFEVIKHFFTANSLEIPLYDKKFVVCSTTNPGDVEQIQKKLSMFNIEVAYNPPITTHGNLVKDYQHSDITIIGSDYDKIKEDLSLIYRQIIKGSVHLYLMSIKSAEITKIGIDGFLAAKITYANVISNLMEKMGVEDEISLVLNAINRDLRIGEKPLTSTYGFSGPSISKSNRTLIKYLEDLGLSYELPLSVKNDNDYHIQHLKLKYLEINPDKSVPFIFEAVGDVKEETFDESQEIKLCVELLSEGYMIHTYKNENTFSKLLKLSDSYENRLKFFKQGTSPQGCKINLK